MQSAGVILYIAFYHLQYFWSLKSAVETLIRTLVK